MKWRNTQVTYWRYTLISKDLSDLVHDPNLQQAVVSRSSGEIQFQICVESGGMRLEGVAFAPPELEESIGVSTSVKSRASK